MECDSSSYSSLNEEAEQGAKANSDSWHVGCGAPPMRSFEVFSYRDRQLSSKVSWHGRHAMLESDGSSRP